MLFRVYLSLFLFYLYSILLCFYFYFLGPFCRPKSSLMAAQVLAHFWPKNCPNSNRNKGPNQTHEGQAQYTAAWPALPRMAFFFSPRNCMAPMHAFSPISLPTKGLSSPFHLLNAVTTSYFLHHVRASPSPMLNPTSGLQLLTQHLVLTQPRLSPASTRVQTPTPAAARQQTPVASLHLTIINLPRHEPVPWRKKPPMALHQLSKAASNSAVVSFAAGPCICIVTNARTKNSLSHAFQQLGRHHTAHGP